MSVGEALPRVIEQSYSRIPLYNKQPGDLKRVLYMRDLLEAVAAGRYDTRLDDLGHEMLYVPQWQSIAQLFHQFRGASRHLASVVDEYGMVRGVVTMEDLMEELVGEIYDETDIAPEALTRISEDEISVDGTAELRVVEECFGIDLPGKPTDTVGFWVLSNIEYIPREQEVFVIDDLAVTIVKASRRCIERVSIRHSGTPPEQVSG
jgi:CBS domain containing-hemolysin-like protein